MSDTPITDRIIPHYETHQPNTDVELYKGAARLEQKGEQVEGETEIILRWTADGVRQFDFRSNYEGDAIKFGEAELWLDALGSTAKIHVTGIGGKRGRFTGVLLDDFAFGSKTVLRSLLFHLVNFPRMDRGSSYPQSETTTSDGRKCSSSWSRVELNAGVWQIIFDPVESIAELESDLRVNSGHAITWAGRIERSDGQEFDAAKGREIAKALTFFSSFAVGRWCPAILLVGYDSEDEKIWENWGPEISDGWEYSKGWLDSRIGHRLSNAFPGFLTKWEKDVWRKPLEDAIHWFIEVVKCSPGVDGSIALGQIGLEMMSWVAFVEDVAVVQERSFGNLPAADKLNMLIHQCEIPLEVPDALSSLKSIAKAENWNGAEAVTNVRNWIIHAHKKNREKLADMAMKHSVDKRNLIWDVYKLLLWYIQLVLLHQFSYAGEYANRLVPRKLGEVESVPWANKSKR